MLYNQFCDGSCRVCKSRQLRLVLDYGRVPIAEVLLKKEELDDPPVAFPLTLVFCENCSMLQLKDCAPMENIYGEDYPYYSSQSQTLIDHYGESAAQLIKKYKLDARSRVIEIASNDGYMLQVFKKKGIPVLGIDPAAGPAQVAEEKGIPTIQEFFDKELAERLVTENRRADLIIANNTLNLLPNPKDFADGIDTLLKPNGRAVFEGNYAVNLISKCQFDMVFHANLCYFSLTSLDHLFRNSKLFINEVQETEVFGGSLRIFIERQDSPKESVIRMLEKEKSLGVHNYLFYKRFAEKARSRKLDIINLLKKLKSSNKRLAIYGSAGGMSTTMINYLKLNKELIDMAVDRNPKKQGLFIPNIQLEIEHPDKLLEKFPDYTLLLAWNYVDEVLSQQDKYWRAGGKFILPIPELKII